MVCQVEDFYYILKLRYRPLAFTSYKAFLKNKRTGAISLFLCMIFEKKYFSCYIPLPDQISLSGCLYFVTSYCFLNIWKISKISFWTFWHKSCISLDFWAILFWKPCKVFRIEQCKQPRLVTPSSSTFRHIKNITP